MGKLPLVLATVLLCSAFGTAQVKPNSEIGRVTVQVPLLSNGKPVFVLEKDEVARVVEVKPGKVTTEEVLVPLAKVRKMRAIVEAENPGVPNPGMPNPGIPNPGMPNPGIPNRGLPNPGIENPGMPNPGIPNPGMPNPGIPNRGLPNPGIENPGMPNPGIPNPGMPNPGIPNPGMPNPGLQSATSEIQHIVVSPVRTTNSPTVEPKRVSSKNCHQLLLASVTVPPTPMPMPPIPAENCDKLCTKFELEPICAHNGICIHEFPNQCIMDTFNCKHRDLAFRAVDEDICRMNLCARRCKEQDLKM